ncbi:MAG: helix-turn-helix domain-containing protein [Rhodospirillales bacterium]
MVDFVIDEQGVERSRSEKEMLTGKLGYRARRIHGGRWLRARRLELNLTQEQLSQRLDGYSNTMISAIETGGPALPQQHWDDYADALEVDTIIFKKNMSMYYAPIAFDSLMGAPTQETLENGLKK